MKLIVDRISDEFAVCETEEQTFVKVPLSLLPPKSKEGSVLRFSKGEYVLDPMEEAVRRRGLHELQSSLLDNSKS